MEKIKTVFRMSASGHCPKRLSYQMLGYEALPAPKYLMTSGEEGKWHEGRIIEELKADDIAVYGEQDELTISRDGIVLIGHRDGIANDHSSEMLLEVKSMSQFEFDRWMRGGFDEFPAYQDQLVCYIVASGLTKALYIVKNRNNGYIDRRVIELEPSIWQASVDKVIWRLTKVEEYVEKDQLYPANFSPTSYECRRCEYRQHCLLPAPRLTSGQEREFDKVVQQWREGERLYKQGNQLLEEATAILRQRAEDMPELKFAFDGLITTVYAIHSVTYPKKEVEKLLQAEQLAAIAKVSDRYACRIVDIQKKEDNSK